MSSEVHFRQVPFKFKLGELTLFSIRRPMVVENCTLRDVMEGGFDPNRPPEACPSEAAGVLRRSYRTDGALPALSTFPGWIRYVPHQFPRHFILLEGSFDEYLQSFSAKTRATLRRKVRRMADAFPGALECRTYRAEHEIDEFYQAAREISSKTYQERLLDSGLPSGEDFRIRLKSLSKEGKVCGFLLWASGRPVSFIYCPVENDSLVYTYLGYDPSFREYSPGSVLQWMVLETLFAEARYRVFDFSEGSGQHKRLFATGSVQCADIYWLRSVVANVFLVRGHYLLNRLSDASASALERVGLKAKLKRFLRFGRMSAGPRIAAGNSRNESNQAP